MERLERSYSNIPTFSLEAKNLWVGASLLTIPVYCIAMYLRTFCSSLRLSHFSPRITLGIAISAPKDPPDFESGKCFDMVAQSKCLASLFGWGGATLFMYLARRIRADERQEKDTSKAKGVFEMLIICFLCAFFGSICQLSLKCFFSQLAFVPEVLTEGTNFYMITFCFVCSMLLLEVWRQRGEGWLAGAKSGWS